MAVVVVVVGGVLVILHASEGGVDWRSCPVWWLDVVVRFLW